MNQPCCILDALNLELRIEGKPSIGMIGGLTGSCDRMFDSSAISMEMNFPGWLSPVYLDGRSKHIQVFLL